ncbi:MAG: Undecaprenyl-phosphate 4-deoxy-4-formamido-L-arabinose transferase [Holosporales bacterium]
MTPYISVVIPVYNEEEGLDLLHNRLMKAMFDLNKSFEVIYTNDGSKDKSFEKLTAFHAQYPDHIRVIDFAGNYGQHLAIIAGFSIAKGQVVVTLDADLQNPPEEIYKLIHQFEEGYDCVGSFRANRQDTFFRKYVSKMINFIREKITHIKMHDQGCMLRAYSQDIVQKIVASQEASTFIPALAHHFSMRPTEVEVQHDARAFGESKYNLYKLARLNFDLITSFSLVPLQAFTLFGLMVSALSGCLVLWIFVRRILFGPELQGAITLLAIVLFLLSVIIFGIGLIGEYIGRIFQAVSQRPHYTIRKILS